MDDTKSYISSTRENLTEKLAVRFIAYLILFALSCVISFASTSFFKPDGYFIAISPIADNGSTIRIVLSTVQCALSSAVCLLIIFLSAYSVFSQPAASAIIVWRGAALGCAGSLMGSGAVVSVGKYWTLSLTLYFIASAFIILLSAYSYIYSLCLCRAHSSGAAGIGTSVAGEYLRLFMILSGCVFIIGCAAVLLI